MEGWGVKGRRLRKVEVVEEGTYLKIG